MAKPTQQQTKKPEEKAVVPKPAAVPAVVQPVYDYGADAGAGYEGTSAADYSLQFLSVIEALSPQAQEGVEGATPGMLHLTVDDVYAPLVFVVPVKTKHMFVRWKTRDNGGGYVAEYEPGDPVVLKALREAESYGKAKVEGDDLVESFYMYCLTLDSAEAELSSGYCIIPFTRTRIKAYKSIMARMRKLKERPPLFANRLQVTTVRQSKNKNVWHVYDLSPASEGDVRASLIPPQLDGEPHPLLVEAKLLLEALNSGAASANYERAQADVVDTEEVPF